MTTTVNSNTESVNTDKGIVINDDQYSEFQIQVILFY
jgi:hypothetical protein